jgi:hypothetical protein
VSFCALPSKSSNSRSTASFRMRRYCVENAAAVSDCVRGSWVMDGRVTKCCIPTLYIRVYTIIIIIITSIIYSLVLNKTIHNVQKQWHEEKARTCVCAQLLLCYGRC